MPNPRLARAALPAFPLLVAALSLPATGQTSWYSPAAANGAEQNDASSTPFQSPTHRYQQVHADLRGAARVFTALALRRDGAGGAQSSAVARTSNVALVMSHGSFGSFGTSYGDNYVDYPSRVFDAKNVSLPDWVANQGAPAPWTLSFPFDQPFGYDGASDLLWELLVYSTTATGAYAADAHRGTGGATGLGVHATTGTGCVAWLGGGPVTVIAAAFTNGGTRQLELDWRVRNIPSFALTSVLVGTTGANLQVPGLCTNLRVDGIFAAFMGLSNANSGFASPPIQVPWEAAFVGARLHAQAVVDDHWQSVDIKVALSNGVSTTIGALGTQTPVRRLWADDVAAMTGNLTETAVTYGLAVRFTGR